ncbi:hypothetical protein LCGC14_1710640 [marine sediment metagenome]|uniref:Uncharacterized protein n=1 Tax=marine sediment metagenome TaxID=412755 RepID=A0A0F9HEW1_9ZZZZ
MQTEQPVAEVQRTYIGPAAWQYPKFRVTLKTLQAKARRPGTVTQVPVDHINRYCEWVEKVGNPNVPQAITSLMSMFEVDAAKAKAILSNANSWSHRIQMPLYYHRLTWGTRIRKAKEKESTPEPRKSDIVFGDARFAHLEEEQRRLDSLLKGLADALDNNIVKVVKEVEGRLERAEHRLQVLDEDLNKVLVGILAKGESIAELQGKMILVENKLRGIRKVPSLPTKLHREIRRRLKVLIAGGK